MSMYLPLFVTRILANRTSAIRFTSYPLLSCNKNPPGNKVPDGLFKQTWVRGKGYFTSKSCVSGVCSDESPT